MTSAPPLDDLDIFARVAEAKSFSKAARALRQPTSTVSRGIARLEASLGVQLLVRTTRALALTTDGAALLSRVTPGLLSLREAVRSIAEGSERPHGLLRITAPYDLGVEWLSELVSVFVARFPEVQVDVQLTGRTVDLVSEGFDLALRAGRLKDSTLVAKRIHTLEAACYASPSYLARAGTPKTPQDLANHEFVLFRAEGHRATLRLTGPREASVNVDVRGHINGDDFAFVRAALRSGVGIGVLPRFMGQTDAREGRLVHVLPGWDGGRGGQLHVVYPAAQHLPAKVLAFRDLVLERAPALLL